MSRDALVVGISGYRNLPDLNGTPAIDGEAIAQRLTQDGDFRVTRLPEIIQQGQPQMDPQRPVSRNELKKAIEQLFLANSSSQAPETALFYFSGHGLPDDTVYGFNHGYLATSETHPQNPQSGLSLLWLQTVLSKSPVKQQVVWLDCCYSGGLIINQREARPEDGESRDRFFIASSRNFENSWQALNSPYSVFTEALLDSLDPNRLTERRVDTFALMHEVNQRLRGELQSSVFYSSGEAINLTRASSALPECREDSQPNAEICPYKGLEAFDCNDTQYFFGRQRLIDDLLAEFQTSNFIALVGASGSGKSSVLQAGLLHQIQLGQIIEGSDQWQIRRTSPDRQPLSKLAKTFIDNGGSHVKRAEELQRVKALLQDGVEGIRALIQTSSAPKILWVVDQFEEVFTQCQDSQEREQYFSCLMGALTDPSDKLRLVIAMRADFIGKCLERTYSGLAQQIQNHMISVLPMEQEELREAICKPAEQVGLQIEPTLVTQILNDFDGAPGSLSLLQYTLTQLYNYCQGNMLTVSAYHALGGIAGTLNQQATKIYNRLEEEQQKTAQYIFLQLTLLGEGTGDTGQQVFQKDLEVEPDHSTQRVQEVIATFSGSNNRLLVTSEVVRENNDNERLPIVEVAHEALIRHWTLLRQWIEQYRDDLRIAKSIETDAEKWRQMNKDKDYLWKGKRLNDAERQEVRKVLNRLGRQFIKASKKEEQKEQQRHKNLLDVIKKNKKAFIIIWTMTTAVFTIIAIDFARGERMAKIEALIAKSNVLIADKYLLEATRTTSDAADTLGRDRGIRPDLAQEIRNNLFQLAYDVAGFDILDGLEGHKDWIYDVKISPGNTRIATVGADRTLKLWTPDPDSPIEVEDDYLMPRDWIFDWSPLDPSQNLPCDAHKNRIHRVAFNSNSSLIATASKDNLVKIMDIETGECTTLDPSKNSTESPQDENSTQGVHDVRFSHEDELIVTASGDQNVRVWGTEDGELKQILKFAEDDNPGEVFSATFSPHSKYIIAGNKNGCINVWDRRGKPFLGCSDFKSGDDGKIHNDQIVDLEFSPDGESLLTASWDNSVRIWDWETKELKTVLEGHTDRISGMSVQKIGKEFQENNPCYLGDPGDYIIATASWDRTVKIWNQKGSLLKTLHGHTERLSSVHFGFWDRRYRRSFS